MSMAANPLVVALVGVNLLAAAVQAGVEVLHELKGPSATGVEHCKTLLPREATLLMARRLQRDSGATKEQAQAAA